MATIKGSRLIRDDNTEVQIVAITGLDGNSSLSSSLPAGTDRSGSITTGGTAQSLVAANTSRQSLKGQNISAGNLGLNEIGGTAVIGAAGTYTVAAGQAFSVSTNRAVSIVGATTGQAFTATET